jgi:hypothetical protein
MSIVGQHFGEITVGNNTTDKFGIKKIYQSATNLDGTSVREWFSTWDNGIAREWDSNANDPYDPEFLTDGLGDGHYKVDSSFSFSIGPNRFGSSIPRMYIFNQTNQAKAWHNVEVTVYGKRVSDNCVAQGSCSWTGINAYARINHIIDTDSCDDRGYGGRLTNDGNAGFEKVIHHTDGEAWSATVPVWGGSAMPYNQWIGYKFVVYDLAQIAANGYPKVKLELWVDKSNNGTWIKFKEVVDDGTGSVFNHPDACKVGVDPKMQLTANDTRPGSETGKPNRAVFFRSDDVNNAGLLYKVASIREISVFS